LRQNWGEICQKQRYIRDPPPLFLHFLPLPAWTCPIYIFSRRGERGENTTKKRHTLEVNGPDATAKRTIEHLTEKVKHAQVNPSLKQSWEQNYFSGIEKYADDPERVRAAEEKLGIWYGVVMDKVAPEFSGVMMKARAEYYKRLAKKYRRLAEEEEGEEEGDDDDLGLKF